MAKRKRSNVRAYLAAILLMGFSLYTAPQFDFPASTSAEEPIVQVSAELPAAPIASPMEIADEHCAAPPLPEHVLQPIVELAQTQYDRMALEIRDYT
ncbi:MAG: hypothetical protein KDA42_17040, partial [Planctomycetales bacterium]|nr:hypothetical protein [Planctomycetales bacterium]